MGSSLGQGPLLGGGEWARRIETEARIRTDATGLGGLARFEWGPWATFELEGRFYPSNERFLDLRLPVRIALSEDVVVAPFLGYSGRLGGVPMGAELRFRVDSWRLRGSTFSLLGSERSEFRLQADRLLKDAGTYRAYVGASAAWEHFSATRDERSVFLVTGLRI